MFSKYYLPTAEIKHYDIMINWINFFLFFHQKIKNDFRVYENVQKVETSKVFDYTTNFNIKMTQYNTLNVKLSNS